MNEADFLQAKADNEELAELSDRFEASAERAAGAGAVLDAKHIHGGQNLTDRLVAAVLRLDCTDIYGHKDQIRVAIHGVIVDEAKQRPGLPRRIAEAADDMLAISDDPGPVFFFEDTTVAGDREVQDADDIVDSDGRLAPKGLR